MAFAGIAKAVITYLLALRYAVPMFLYYLYQTVRHPDRKNFTVKPRESPPEVLKDVALGEHGYITVQGLKIHYVEKGDRSKPLMLFVHGFPEFWFSWRHQMAEFSKDYWTVAIDMRGYGDSDKPSDVSAYSINNLIDDIRYIVEALGREKFTLVAHDWGAVISWCFIDKYPNMIEKYIMMNGPHPQAHGKLLKHGGKQAAMSWYITFFQLPILPEMWVQWNDFELMDKIFVNRLKNPPTTTKDDVEAFKYTFGKPGACTPPINYYRAMVRNRLKKEIFGQTEPNVTKSTPERKRPSGLFIFGEKDMFLDIKTLALHEELFPGLKTIIIKNANHFVQQDDPNAVNNAMRSFLGKN